jgi:ankyrin repeat protein
MIFEFVLNNGGAPVIFTEEGMDCVFFAARTNNKKAFDLLLKNGFDPNRKGPNGKTVLEFLVEQNIKVDPEIMNKLKATTKPSLFSMVLESNADGLKKALEDKENLAAINKPIPPLDGSVAGQTLLEHALDPRKSPHRETVKTLLDAGATFKAGDIGGLMLHQHEDILPLFWEHRDRMSEGDWEKCFTMSATYRNADAFKFFLEKGFDPESMSDAIYSQGTQEMVDVLDARGFKKPFWAAVKWNDLDLAKEYVTSGVNVNDGKMSLPVVAGPGVYEPYMDRMLFGSADGGIPLLAAVEAGNLEMTELLLQNGAFTKPEDYFSRKTTYPIIPAVKSGNSAAMTELLLKYAINTDAPWISISGRCSHVRKTV